MGWPPTVLGGHGEGWDTGGGFKNMVGLAARSEERDPGGGHPLEVHVTQEGAPTDHHPWHPLHLRPRPQAGGWETCGGLTSLWTHLARRVGPGLDRQDKNEGPQGSLRGQGQEWEARGAGAWPA